MLFLLSIALVSGIGVALLYNKQQNDLASPTQSRKPDISANQPDNSDNINEPSLYGQVRSFYTEKINSVLQKTDTTSSESLDLVESDLNRRILLAAGSIGLVGIGILGHPLVSIASIPLQLYLFLPHFKGAWKQLFKDHEIKMEVLDATIISLLLLNRFLILNGIYLMFLGFARKFIHRAKRNSTESLTSIFGSIPREAWIEVNGVEVQCPVSELLEGDIVFVRAGETIPVDGAIVQGMASIDQHMLTGEAQPIEKGVGDSVLAATILLSGRIAISVSKAGEQTVAAQIDHILSNTASYQSGLELRGQVIADKTALPVLALGAVTMPLLGLSSAIAVLLCDIGYRMRFIGPLSVLNYLVLVSQESIMVKDGRALEELQDVDTFVFDKTGTLTQEQPTLQAIYPCGVYTQSQVLTYAAAAEHRQTHPIARAILQAAELQDLALPEINQSSYQIGYGLRVQIGENELIRVGSARFMDSEGIGIPEDIQAIHAQAAEQGESVVYVARNEHLAGVIVLQATIRPEAQRILRGLHERGMTLYVISGDQEQPTRRLAESLGIDHYFAQVLPEDKASLIEKLQAEGRTVCFVGDGINDSIALKRANVSVSLRGASTIATDTAQVVLMDESLGQLLRLYDLCKGLEQNMKVNFATSVVPGVMCIAGVYLLGWGIIAAGALGMFSFALGLANAHYPLLQAKNQPQKALESGEA